MWMSPRLVRQARQFSSRSSEPALARLTRATFRTRQPSCAVSLNLVLALTLGSVKTWGDERSRVQGRNRNLRGFRGHPSSLPPWKPLAKGSLALGATTPGTGIGVPQEPGRSPPAPVPAPGVMGTPREDMGHVVGGGSHPRCSGDTEPHAHLELLLGGDEHGVAALHVGGLGQVP